LSAGQDAVAAVLALLPDAVLLVDSAGRIDFANPRACEMLSRAQGELQGRPLDGFVAEEPQVVADLLRLYARGSSTVPGSLTLRRASSLVACRCEGAALRRRDGDRPALPRAV
jgi:PAS domain S-box-containing protein